MTIFDMDALIESKVDFSFNTKKEEHPKDAFVRRIREMTVFFISIFLIISAFIFCGYILLSHHYSPESERWAMTVGTSILTSFLSYLAGKNIN